MDGTVRHWDPDGKLLAVMKTHCGRAVTCGDYTTDGRWLVTGAEDMTVRIWPLRRDDLLRIAKERVPRDFTPAERERFAALLPK
jgi:WD40 repeat protein